jgi:hypothetical protein
MIGSRIDALARQAATIDRKTALAVLGGTLAAVAAARPMATPAKYRGVLPGFHGVLREGQPSPRCQFTSRLTFRPQNVPSTCL